MIDNLAILNDLTMGVAGNALTALLSQLGKSAKKRFSKTPSTHEPITTLIRKALEENSTNTNIDTNGTPIEEVCLFITSPEVETIIRQLYSTNIINKANQKQTVEIQREFFLAAQNLAGISSQELTQALWESLVSSCETHLSQAVNSNSLPAYDARNASRHRILYDELTNISRHIQSSTRHTHSSISEILEFEEKYRIAVHHRHGYITPPHLDASNKFPINSLYVAPAFSKSPKKKEQKSTPIGLDDFLERSYRTVVLGNPGGGKSTLAAKLTHDLSDPLKNTYLAHRKATPILVILREYGATKQTSNVSILQFIEATSNSRYQLTPPPGAFEYLLTAGRAFVIFDGLDELLNTASRRDIAADVESFGKLYPSVPILVTSREVGYEQAPLDSAMFEPFQLAPFAKEQVENYSRRWFAIDRDITPTEQESHTAAFMAETHTVPDLRSNPLMLALLCNIYKGQNYIPRNRPEVYEKCATMLFERWDRSRNINTSLPFDSHIRPAMMHLAHWIYNNIDLQAGASEDRLILKAQEYLLANRFEDTEEAKSAATEFIKFCRGRAWVFTDTGTTKEGIPLYQFTHRTFLEYFTAAFLVRTSKTVQNLWTKLKARVETGEWDVVAQLAFQILHRQKEGAGDELLELVLRQSRKSKKPKATHNLLSFAARTLEFMIPTPKAVRATVTNCLNTILTPEETKDQDRARLKLLQHLLNSATENRNLSLSIIQESIIKQINSQNNQSAVHALDVGLFLHIAAPSGIQESPEVHSAARKITKEIFTACETRILDLSQQHPMIASAAFWNKKVSIRDLYNRFGTTGIFKSTSSSFYTGGWISPAYGLLLHSLSSSQIHTAHQTWLDRQLTEAWEILSALELPWSGQDMKLDYTPVTADRGYAVSFERASAMRVSKHKEPFLGMLAIISCTIEASHSEFNLNFTPKECRDETFHLVNSFMTARDRIIGQAEAHEIATSLGLVDLAYSIFTRWMRREISMMSQPFQISELEMLDDEDILSPESEPSSESIEPL